MINEILFPLFVFFVYHDTLARPHTFLFFLPFPGANERTTIPRYLAECRTFFSCQTGPYWFSSKELFIKSLNGVGKEKKLFAKKWYKKELV
jgi:hypothetical protein